MLEMTKTHIRHFLKLKGDTKAVTAMEYGLIAALVAVVIITGLTTIGTTLEATFVSIGSKI
jgi:pilus assembly protein Flp/PilA